MNFEVPSTNYNKKYIGGNTDPKISSGWSKSDFDYLKTKSENNFLLDSEIQKEILETFCNENNKRLKDLIIPKSKEFFNWWEALQLVLPSETSNKLVSAHFDSESLEACLTRRDFVVRVNITSKTRKNPKLLLDRSMAIEDNIPGTLLDRFGKRIKTMKSKEEMLNYFSKSSHKKPNLITHICELGLTKEILKLCLDLLEDQGNLVIKFGSAYDQQTIDLIEYLSSLFNSVEVIRSSSNVFGVLFLICKSYTKDKYESSKDILEKSPTENFTFNNQNLLKGIRKFNYKLISEAIEYTKSTIDDSKYQKWLENMVIH